MNLERVVAAINKVADEYVSERVNIPGDQCAVRGTESCPQPSQIVELTMNIPKHFDLTRYLQKTGLGQKQFAGAVGNTNGIFRRQAKWHVRVAIAQIEFAVVLRLRRR
jgi:hypothetical protein